MRKLSQKEFINKCLEVHGDRYDYSLVEYKSLSSKIKILCNLHGMFEQNSKNHRDGQGCPICSGRVIKTKNEYLKHFNTSKYDYSLVNNTILKNNDYIKIIDKDNGLVYMQLLKHHKKNMNPSKIESNSLVKKLKKIHNSTFEYVIEKETYYSTDKIKIINRKNKDQFYYRVDRHLSGMKPSKVTINYFLIKSREIHGDKYDYSLIKSIKTNSEKVEIICKEHGVFTQRVSNHMNLGDGCPKCAGVGKWNTELLISEFKNVHGNKFDYSKVEFKNVDKKVEIICKEHGNFKQNIHKHLKGQGCRFCESSSKGEEYVKMWLDEMNINYFRQHIFKTCRYINPLFFDFYLPIYDTCIEFDGEQHYKPVSKFGGMGEFNNRKLRDNVKNKWCLDNNINLIRIKYNEINKIKYILQEKLQIVDKK
jgi:very-short-patch-repair endonuclease